MFGVKRQAAEYLRDWIEGNMPLRVDQSLPTDVLTALEELGAGLRESPYWTDRGYPQSELERLDRILAGLSALGARGPAALRTVHLDGPNRDRVPVRLAGNLGR